MIECEWLPDLWIFDDVFPNKDAYYDSVYKRFKKDFIDSVPMFKGKEIQIKTTPIVNGKEESFRHITTKDYYHGDNREFDMLRCERIQWIRKLIENYNCNKESCDYCSGIKTWEYPYQKRIRTKILFEEERFIVILENRATYYLLVTAFYVDSDIRLANFIEEYNKTKSAS